MLLCALSPVLDSTQPGKDHSQRKRNRFLSMLACTVIPAGRFAATDAGHCLSAAMCRLRSSAWPSSTTCPPSAVVVYCGADSASTPKAPGVQPCCSLGRQRVFQRTLSSPHLRRATRNTIKNAAVSPHCPSRDWHLQVRFSEGLLPASLCCCVRCLLYLTARSLAKITVSAKGTAF